MLASGARSTDYPKDLGVSEVKLPDVAINATCGAERRARNGVWSSRFRRKTDDDESKVRREMGKGGAFRGTLLGIVMTS